MNTIKDVLKYGDRTSMATGSGHQVLDGSRVHGLFHLKVNDPVYGKYEFDAPNILTTAGKNLLLTSGPGTLYMGLINENRHVTDGVISGQPTTTFSSATASFVAGDVNRYITIFGGLSGPANFNGTISSQSGTACVVSGSLTLNGTSLIASIGPLLAAVDTAGAHAGWTELSSAEITNATRPSWGYGAASAGAITNASGVVFTMASGITTQFVHGIFTSSLATLGGSTGTLFSEAVFSGASPGCLMITQNATITVTYTVTLT